jgi:hypothetical protein
MFLFNHILESLRKVGGSICGWVLTVLSSAGAFFATEKYCFYLVLTAIMLDALFGTIVSVHKKRGFALSRLGRVTTFKILSYGASLAIVFMIEKLTHDAGFIGIKIAAGWAAACEFWSMSASILIIWPNAPFFRIIRRQLKGEIASKLGKPIDDILPEDGNSAR